jgi:hypothetical protein
MRTIRSRLTYANVIATLALFIAVGGATAFAASKLGKNSVGTKQIKNSAVTAAKIKKGTITGTQVKNGSLGGTQVNASTLGTVPSAQSANTAHSAQTAQTANTVAAPEAWHEVGTSGQPGFLNSWENVKISLGAFPETVAFYKDQDGIVHLRGDAISGTSGTAIFNLPPGFRPTSRRFIREPVACGGASGTDCEKGASSIAMVGSSSPAPAEEGAVIAPSEASSVSLDGVTFRAES